MIHIQNVFKTYQVKNGAIPVLRDCSLSFPDTGLFFIVGKSGCGKTTLLNLMAGLDSFDSGSIQMDGKEIDKYSFDDLDRMRNREIGVIFQSNNLLNDCTVLDNVLLPLQIQTWEGKNQAVCLQSVYSILEYVGLAQYGSRKINELSGGECQRVAIARALIKEPRVIFADEPTGNLDSKNGESIFSLLKEISHSTLVVVVSHDLGFAQKYGDAIIRISDGMIVSVEKQRDTANIFRIHIAEEEGVALREEIVQDSARLRTILDEYLSSDNYSFSIHREKKSSDAEFAPYEAGKRREEKRKNIRPCSLPWKCICRISGLFLRKKAGRLCIAVLLLAVTVALMIASLFLADFDDLGAEIRYCEQYSPSVLVPFAESSYTNSLYDTVNRTVMCGEPLQTKLAAQYPNRWYKLYYDQSLENTNNGNVFSQTCIALSEAGKKMIYAADEGEYPKEEQDIMLSDYVAAKLSVKIGDFIDWDGRQMTVCGIFKTGSSVAQIDSQLNRGMGEYFSYDCSTLYFLAVVSKKIVPSTAMEERFLTLSAADFLRSTSEKYYETRTTYGTISAERRPLLSGRMPETKNEVLVSEEYLESHFLTLDFSSQDAYPYAFKNLAEEKYNGAYGDTLNMTDVFPDGVLVSGVYSRMDYGTVADVLIAPEIYNKIYSLYSQYYENDAILIGTDKKDYGEMLHFFDENQLQLTEPGLMTIVGVGKGIRELLPLIWVLVGMMAAITVLALTNYISASIKENEKDLGILKALGVTSRDVTRIFLYETVLTYLLSSVFAIGIDAAVLHFVNCWFAGMTERIIQIAVWNMPMTILAVVLALIFTLLCTILPIRRIARKKPMEIIRNNE